MNSDVGYASPQPANAVASPTPKHNKRNRHRKSSNVQQAASPLDNGNASDSANVSANSAVATQQTPKPRNRHPSSTIKHNNSPRGQPRNTQPATPLKREEYAGARYFESSPAPGSLPLPKFFKQVAAPAASPGRTTDDEGDNSAPDSPSKAPVPQALTLNRLLAADRQERAIKEHQRTQEQPTPLQHANSPYGGYYADNRPSSGLIQSPEPQQTPPVKDPKAMADDLKRILKIGNFS